MTTNKTTTIILDNQENSVICDMYTILEQLSYAMSCDDIAYINGNTYNRDDIDSAKLLLFDLYYQKSEPIEIKGDE